MNAVTFDQGGITWDGAGGGSAPVTPGAPGSFPQLIFATLSALFAGQVYPLVAPEACVPPYAVYTQVGSAPSSTISDGIVFEQDRYQIDVYAAGFAECRTLAVGVRAALLAIPYPVAASLIDESYQYEPEVLWHRAISEFYLSQARSNV